MPVAATACLSVGAVGVHANAGGPGRNTAPIVRPSRAQQLRRLRPRPPAMLLFPAPGLGLNWAPVNGGAAGGPAALAGLGAEGSSGCLKQQEAVNLSVLVLAWEAGLYCSILALQGRLQAILPPFSGPPLVLPRLQPGRVAGYRGTGAC